MHTVFKILATLFNGAMLATCIPSLAYIPWPASLIMVVMALIYMLMIIAIYRSHIVLKLLTVVACLFQLLRMQNLDPDTALDFAITVGGPVVTLLAVFGGRKPEAAPAAPSTTDNPA